MNSPSPYNANPELSAMKEDIASRNYWLTVKDAAIRMGSIAAGVVIGALLVPALPAGLGVAALVGGGGIGLIAGGAIANVVTLKDRTKLAIDEQHISSYMSGKNYWGEGYREEVAEYGYGGAQQPHHGGVPNHRTTERQV